jgi:hypothetical protein
MRPDRQVGRFETRHDREDRERRERERRAIETVIGLIGAGGAGTAKAGGTIEHFIDRLSRGPQTIAGGKTGRLKASTEGDDLFAMMHPEMLDPTAGTDGKTQREKDFMERQRQLTGPLETMPSRPLKVDRLGEINIPGFKEATDDPFHELDVNYSPGDTLSGGTGTNTLPGKMGVDTLSGATAPDVSTNGAKAARDFQGGLSRVIDHVRTAIGGTPAGQRGRPSNFKSSYVTRAQRDFFARHMEYARQAGLTGVQAELAVAQAAQETGWGTKGKAIQGNNFHGIKKGEDWKGATISLPTKEEVGGKLRTETASFRQYESPVESYRDWGNLMEKNFPDVMKAATFDDAVEGLDHGRLGKYSTSSKYADRLKEREKQLASTLPDITGTSVDVHAQKKNDNLPASAPKGVAPGGMVDGYRAKLSSVDFDKFGLDPAAKAKAKEFQREAIQRGLGDTLAVDVKDMTRTPERQKEIKASGYSWTNFSEHMYGAAIDVSPVDVNDQKAWADKRTLASELGWSQLGSNDPAHMGITPEGLSKQQAYADSQYFGSVPALQPGDIPTPTARPDLVPPGEEVARAPLDKPAERIQPSPSVAERVAPAPSSAAPQKSALREIADALNPVSPAHAEPGPARAVQSPEKVAAQKAFEQSLEHVIGRDVTQTANRPVPPDVAALSAPKERVTPSVRVGGILPDVGPTFSPVGTTERVSPIAAAERLGALPATKETVQPDSPISINSVQEALQPEQAPRDRLAPAPSQAQTLSPLADYETQLGVEVPDEKAKPKEAPLAKPITVAPRPVVASVPKVVAVPKVAPAAPTRPAVAPKPALSVADVLGGTVGQATATDGNVVSRDAYDRTAVTNKYGKTTVTLPDGRQAASNQKGPLTKTSLSSPIDSLFDSKSDDNSPGRARKTDHQIAGLVLGGVLGALAGGPAGALSGAALGNRVMKPGTLIDRMFTSYPGAPTNPKGYNGGAYDHDFARGISPDAAYDIEHDVAGLF